MNKRIYTGLIALVFSLNVFAGAKKESLDTIPFMVYQQPAATTANFASNSHGGLEVKHIPVAEMQSLVIQMRSTICKYIGDGNIRVWVAGDVNGKLAIVNASAQAGLEITIHCNNRKK